MVELEAEDEILVDIGKHFTVQLHRLLNDTADTCNIAEVDARVTARMLMAILLCEAVQGAVAMKISERGFLQACKEGYKLWREIGEKEEPQRRTH